MKINVSSSLVSPVEKSDTQAQLVNSTGPSLEKSPINVGQEDQIIRFTDVEILNVSIRR